MRIKAMLSSGKVLPGFQPCNSIFRLMREIKLDFSFTIINLENRSIYNFVSIVQLSVAPKFKQEIFAVFKYFFFLIDGTYIFLQILNWLPEPYTNDTVPEKIRDIWTEYAVTVHCEGEVMIIICRFWSLIR
jgi:hypothetical protein